MKRFFTNLALFLIIITVQAQPPGYAVLDELDIDPNMLLQRIEQVNNDIKEKGIIFNTQFDTKLLTGYSYGEFFDWDLYFENIYMSYFGISDYCFTNFKAFMNNQFPDGFIGRILIHDWDLKYFQHFKPFLAQIAWLGSVQENDFEWLNERDTRGMYKNLVDISYFEQLKLYLDHWFWYRDFDKNGLPVWDSADHSGMDNQDSRAGAKRSNSVEGVDLACYLIRELQAMSRIAEKLGLTEDQKYFTEKAKAVTKLVNTVFWDEQDGFYYDRHERTGELVKIKSVAGFIPIWLGIVPNERLERLVTNHLLNSDEFWLTYPIATFAKTEPDYFQDHWPETNCNWLGTAWIPTNYMIFHGLKKAGYSDIAKELADKTFKMVLLQNNITREYYNAETGKGQGLGPFWGWSILGYFMPFEFALDYDPLDFETVIRPLAIELFDIKF